MAIFIVQDTIPVYVTWEYEIEAATADEALQVFRDDMGQPTDRPPIIGDSVDGANGEITILDENGNVVR